MGYPYCTMTGSEVRQIRERWRETQGEFAQRLGVHKVTLARWEVGMRRVSGTAETLLRLLAKTAPRRASKPGRHKGRRR